jgi:hypothetical protein
VTLTSYGGAEGRGELRSSTEVCPSALHPTFRAHQLFFMVSMPNKACCPISGLFIFCDFGRQRGKRKLFFNTSVLELRHGVFRLREGRGMSSVPFCVAHSSFPAVFLVFEIHILE